MSEAEINGRIEALEQQRNEALNRVVLLHGALAVAQVREKELLDEIGRLESLFHKKPAIDDDGAPGSPA